MIGNKTSLLLSYYVFCEKYVAEIISGGCPRLFKLIPGTHYMVKCSKIRLSGETETNLFLSGVVIHLGSLLPEANQSLLNQAYCIKTQVLFWPIQTNMSFSDATIQWNPNRKEQA